MDLFGPGQHKAFFYLFDYCQNLEYFSQDLPATDGAAPESLSKRLFTTRLELIGELDKRQATGSVTGRFRESPAAYGEPHTDADVREALGDILHTEVAAMNLDNFVVRPRRRVIEKPQA